MAGVQKRKIQCAISLLLVMLYFSGLTAQAQYGGGTGEPNDPYQIATAEDLILLGESPEDYDKHFILTANIDLDPNLPGRKVFDKAVIAPDTEDWSRRFQGTSFTGVFYGSGHTISHLTIRGVNNLGLFGKLDSGARISNLGLEAVDVIGTRERVGGLIGYNSGHVLNCYSTGAVGGDGSVGGLAGRNEGFVTECYSAAAVSGTWLVGGLVGSATNRDRVTYCFWDTQTSGQATSAGGTGKTTAEMQMASTFTEAGWDFVDETENGAEDIWWILEGQDYPKLRELPEGLRLGPLPAFSPDPQDGAIDVTLSPILHWAPTEPTVQHHVYFGESKQAVANATTSSVEIYCDPQPGEVTSYEPGVLEWAKNYYWRIDEYNPDGTISKGNVWSFTTVDFILVAVVDDFEYYNDLDPGDPKSRRIFNIWIDGYGIPTNGSLVGCEFPLRCPEIAHGGKQSMLFSYNNTGPANYSEAERTWATPQDWMINGADTLTLYCHGAADNERDSLYVAIEDSAGRIAVLTHPNADAVLTTQWQKWHIPLADLLVAGVDAATVKKMYIGVGDRDNPQPGGVGMINIDDIQITHRMP